MKVLQLVPGCGMPVLLIVLLLGMKTSVAQYRMTPRENVVVSSQINGFWEHLPADYYTNPTRKYPLIVYWHGVGEVGDGQLPSMQLLIQKALGQKIEIGRFPDVVYNAGTPYSFMVLIPQYRPGLAVSVEDMDAMMNYAFSHYRVDRNRVYLTGISYGSNMIYKYVGTSPAYAQKITGIAPLAVCTGAEWGQAGNIAANNVAVWGIHCEFDIQCVPYNTIGWIDLINSAAGTPPIPSAVYTLTELQNPGDPHDLFWTTFEPDFSRAPTFKNLYDWMISYSRNLALPIKLSNFNAYIKDDKTTVDWLSSSEVNTKEFIIQRAGSNLKFGDVGSLPASGTSSSNKSYRWIDNQPLKGINYYRLVLVNKDNTKEFFEIKKVFNKAQGDRIVIAPNPVERELNIYLTIDRAQKLDCILTDVQGRILQRQSNTYQPGLQQVHFSMANMPAGTYMVELKGDGFSEVRKVIRK